uniref:Uncharacterized protein n=1 Tax=Bombyx mori TaxID=7091 RepID=A0A8R2HT65_BOMMO|nr:uncharacterized protein LOC110386384 [Bombyx mori]
MGPKRRRDGLKDKIPLMCFKGENHRIPTRSGNGVCGSLTSPKTPAAHSRRPTQDRAGTQSGPLRRRDRVDAEHAASIPPSSRGWTSDHRQHDHRFPRSAGWWSAMMAPRCTFPRSGRGNAAYHHHMLHLEIIKHYILSLSFIYETRN